MDSSLKSYQSAIAGSVSGLISTAILHPLDLIKVRFQVHDGIYLTGKIRASEYKGTLNAIYTIAKQEGILSLWTGINANIIGGLTAWGSFFGWYHYLKHRQFNWGKKKQLSSIEHLMAATEAGILTSLLTNPIWIVKTRMCLQGEIVKSQIKNSSSYEYKNFTHGLLTLARKEGFHGLFKGIIPALWGTSHGAFQFVAYEELRRRLHLYKGDEYKQKDSESIAMAAISKLFATSLSYPFQLIKARLQSQDANVRYTSASNTAYLIWKHEGIKGFYKGLIPNVLRVLPNSCLVFMIYERLTRVFRLYNE